MSEQDDLLWEIELLKYELDLMRTKDEFLTDQLWRYKVHMSEDF